MKNIICFDIGTTKLKLVSRINNTYIRESFNNVEANEIIESHVNKNKFDEVLITGTGMRFIEEKNNYVFLDEFEASANIIRGCGLEQGIVVNIGTGTSFLKFVKGKAIHLIGTGIGGGTLIGLSQKLLGVKNSMELERLAQDGKLNEINLTAKDIFENGMGFLQDDVTISNFGKDSTKEENIAIGICSLVAEPIMSILKAHVEGTDIKDIVFCGGVSKNHVIRNLIEKYSTLFGLNSLFLEYPDYGTCFGAISLYDGTTYKQYNKNTKIEVRKTIL